MTDFGVRCVSGGATEAKQNDVITTEEAIQAAAEALTKQVNSVPVNDITFDADPTTYTSAAINCAGYRKFLLRLRLTVANTPATIQIIVQFSQGGATYENYMRGPFGSLLYEDTAGAKNECVEGPVLGAKMRIHVVAVGTDATDTFTLTCKVILTR